MYAIDFNYDGVFLSDFGFIICDFEPSDGANVSDNGAAIEFNKVSHDSGKKWGLASTKYGSCIQTTFDICKDPEITEHGEMWITDDEYRDIVRWLNRREFRRLYFIYDDLQNRDVRYYNASFNVSKIKISEVLYGIRLTMETDKPFGYGKEIRLSWHVDDITKEYVLKDLSDEIGNLLPDIKITCQQSGDLTITNSNNSSPTVIKNCTTGEIITINGSTQIIQTSLSSHAIQNDFNFEFFKISNTLSDRSNRITFSLPCDVEIVYSPIIKDTPIL